MKLLENFPEGSFAGSVNYKVCNHDIKTLILKTWMAQKHLQEKVVMTFVLWALETF
jgi:hypothetical protein